MAPDAPTAAELQANPVVQAAFAAAWADSLTDDHMLRHEEGGFIYVDAATGDVFARRCPSGGRDSLDVTYPPHLPGCYLVGVYHTHPNPSALGFDPTPSSDDYREADDSGVPWFVVTDVGIFIIGPDRREGGLTGPPEYPR